jgi:hypothetical protein
MVKTPGEASTTNNNSNVNVVQNFYGSPPNVMEDARDGVEDAIKASGMRGFG